MYAQLLTRQNFYKFHEFGNFMKIELRNSHNFNEL